MMKQKIPINEKLCLTIEEAAEYSHIGVTTLRDRIAHNDFDFVLKVGTKVLIKRKQFEKWIEKTSVV